MRETPGQRRERRIDSFNDTYRRLVACLAAPGTPLEDLADSFPALLFALATGYGTAPARAAALKAIARGAPLKTIAHALDLPYWMRHLPASALAAPLPVLPADPEFSAAAIARIPDGAALGAAWLARTGIALEVAGRDAALWIMKNQRFLPPTTSLDELLWTLAWIWHSARPAMPAGALVRKPWSPGLGWARSREEVAIWRKRIDLAIALGKGIDDTWFVRGEALGLEFVPLSTTEAFIAESVAMENCLDQYASHVLHGHVRIFSVRKDGRPIADVELTVRPDEVTVAAISQIRGRRNRRASATVWQATHAWLGMQPFTPITCRPRAPLEMRAERAAIWTPFLHAMRSASVAKRLRTITLGVDKAVAAARNRRFSIADACARPAIPIRPPAASDTRRGS